MATNADGELVHLAGLQAADTKATADHRQHKTHNGGVASLVIGEPVHLGWSGVEFCLSETVRAKKPDGWHGKKDGMVLRGLDGVARPGKLTCIIGASGSGKTSLMNVLSGRSTSMNGHTVKCKVTINGTEITPEELGPKIAYVMQTDALCATSTPREALEFSAKLRLPPTISAVERSRMVATIIELLHLQDCADVLIGNDIIKGISGGEKKRTAIGVELVTRPSILFLDEPTSGLDSWAAYKVITYLKELSDRGCTILTTIHQPSSEVFHKFDNVLLLSGGRTLYDGPVNARAGEAADAADPIAADLVEFFKKNGLELPRNTNPADFVMVCMQEQKQKMAKLCDVFADERSRSAIKWDPHSVPTDAGGGDSLKGEILRVQAGVCTQMMALGKRELQCVARDKASLGARFGSAIMLNLVFAMIFFQIGKYTEEDYDMYSHFGALANIAISGMFGAAQPIILSFPSERPLFMREYANGTYSGVAYFWSKMASELPLSFLTSLITFLVTYWIEGLNGNLILHVLTLWMTGLAASSTALCAGCFAPNAQTAMQVAPAIFVPQILFAGFFIKIEQIPAWLRWAQYTCSLKFGVNLHLIVEFDGGCDPNRTAECAALLEMNDVEPASWWLYSLVLVLIFFGFRILAMIALTKKAKGFELA